MHHQVHAEPPREFHLFVVCPGGRPEPVVVPPGVSELLPGAPSSSIELRHASPGLRSGTAFLEPLPSRAADPRLLLLSLPPAAIHINGLPAPRLSLLAEGDRFHFDAGPEFRVALFHRPRLGPPPPEMTGAACPICTLPLAAGDRCLICPCGAAFHAPADESVDGALCCAKLATHCQHCQQPLRFSPGYGESSHPDHD